MNHIPKQSSLKKPFFFLGFGLASVLIDGCNFFLEFGSFYFFLNWLAKERGERERMRRK